MAGRYEDWTHVLVRGDRQAAARHLPYARKLLGYLAEQRRLNPGVPTQIIRRELSDGTAITAQFNGDIPRVEIVQSTRAGSLLERVGGFVTWPTDDAGADALDTARIILAGAEYRGVREGRYIKVFPDGLDRAGNVDWHGKGGWVVSWYGPRTRYFETAPILKPYVFAKGLPIADASTLVDIDAVILGACVTTAFGDTWLVGVSEEFTFGRWEDVWAVRLLNAATSESARPTDAKYTVDAASFEYLDSRFNNTDTTTFRHPWLFNPTGTEGRMLTETDAGLTERIIRLVESDAFACGFAVERDVIAHGPEPESEVSGYTEATFGAYVGKWTGQRRQAFTMSDTGAPSGDTPAGPDSSATPISGTFAVENAVGSYQLVDAGGLTNYIYARDITCAEVWQPVAVDYNAAGEVVYGYARHKEIHETGSGGFAPTAPLPEITATYSSNGWTGSYADIHPDGNDQPGKWGQSIEYQIRNYDVTGGTVMLEAERLTTEDSILGGLKVGALEVLTVRTSSFTETGNAQFEVGTYSQAGDAATAGALGDEGFESFDPNDAQIPTLADYSLGVFGFGSATGHVYTSETNDTSVAESLYLIHMDLRYDALFVCIESNEHTQAVTVSASWTSLDDPPEGTVDTTTDTTDLRTFRVLGYVHGNEVPVVDETVTVRDDTTHDELSQSPTAPDGGYQLLVGNHPWYVTGQTEFRWGAMQGGDSPSFRDWLPITFDTALIADLGEWDAIPPASFSAELVPVDVDPDALYLSRTDTNPIYQQLTLSWHIELEHDRSANVGYSFGTTPNRAQVHWHTDADGVDHLGSWAFYKREWVFSMSLPRKDSTTFESLSRCRISEAESRVLTEAERVLVEHLYPIWVLPNSNRPL